MADSRGISHGPGWWLRNADILLATVEHTQTTVADSVDPATGAIIEQVIFRPPVACIVTGISIIPNSGTTLGASTVINKSTVGTGTVHVASVGVTSVTTARAIAMSLNSGAVTLSANQVLTLRRTTATADTVQASAVVDITYRMQYTKLDGN
jgi:hypothetical protein